MLKKALKIFSQNKLYLPIFLLIAFGGVARFLWLDRFPVGINHDEAEVVLSAKSYWKLGTDISGVGFPESLVANKTAAGMSGLPSFVLAPFFGPLDTSLTNIRLIYLLLNLATLGLVVAIVRLFTRSKLLSLFLVVVGLTNPWFFIYSRTPTEAPFALFFSLLGTYLLFKLEGYRKIISIFSFVLAYYSYFGAKPVTLVFVPLLLILNQLYFKKENWKVLAALITTFLFLIGISLLGRGGGTLTLRGGRDLVFSNLERFSSTVNEQRRASITLPFKGLFYNKGKLLLNEMFSKYFGWLNSDFLFSGGDEPAIYRFGESGMFYVLDFFLVVLGIIALLKEKKIFKYLLGIVFIIAPVGAMVTAIGESYYFRGYLFIPLFIILISLGSVLFFERLKKSFLGLSLIVGIYFLLFSNFLVFFFFRFPVKQQENYFLAGRVLANYLVRARESSSGIKVITTSPHAMYHQYLFYSDYFGGEDISITPPAKTHGVDGIYLTSDCNDTEADILIVDARLNCKIVNKGPFVIIQDQKDAGTFFTIYGDKLCREVALDEWRREHTLSDYAIEKMDSRTFCNRWIQKELSKSF